MIEPSLLCGWFSAANPACTVSQVVKVTGVPKLLIAAISDLLFLLDAVSIANATVYLPTTSTFILVNCDNDWGDLTA